MAKIYIYLPDGMEGESLYDNGQEYVGRQLTKKSAAFTVEEGEEAALRTALARDLLLRDRARRDDSWRNFSLYTSVLGLFRSALPKEPTFTPEQLKDMAKVQRTIAKHEAKVEEVTQANEQYQATVEWAEGRREDQPKALDLDKLLKWAQEAGYLYIMESHGAAEATRKLFSAADAGGEYFEDGSLR